MPWYIGVRPRIRRTQLCALGMGGLILLLLRCAVGFAATSGGDWPVFSALQRPIFADPAIPLATPPHDFGLLCDLFRDTYHAQPMPAVAMSVISQELRSRFSIAVWPPLPLFDGNDERDLVERALECLPVLHHESPPLTIGQPITMSHGSRESAEVKGDVLAVKIRSLPMDNDLFVNISAPPKHLKLQDTEWQRYASQMAVSDPFGAAMVRTANQPPRPRTVMPHALATVVSRTPSRGASNSPMDSIRTGLQQSGMIQPDPPAPPSQQVRQALANGPDEYDSASAAGSYQRVEDPNLEGTLHLLLYYGHTSQVYNAVREYRTTFSRPGGTLISTSYAPIAKMDDGNDAFFNLHLPSGSGPSLPLAIKPPSMAVSSNGSLNASFQVSAATPNKSEVGNSSSPASPALSSSVAH